MAPTSGSDSHSAASPFEHVKYEIQEFIDPVGDPKRTTRDAPLRLVAAYREDDWSGDP